MQLRPTNFSASAAEVKGRSTSGAKAHGETVTAVCTPGGVLHPRPLESNFKLNPQRTRIGFRELSCYYSGAIAPASRRPSFLA